MGVQLSDNLILNIVEVQRPRTRWVLRYLDAEILVARYPDVDENQGLKSFLLILMLCIGLYLLLEVQLRHLLERLLGHEWQQALNYLLSLILLSQVRSKGREGIWCDLLFQRLVWS